MIISCRSSAFFKAKWSNFLMWINHQDHPSSATVKISKRRRSSAKSTKQPIIKNTYYCTFCSHHEEDQKEINHTAQQDAQNEFDDYYISSQQQQQQELLIHPTSAVAPLSAAAVVSSPSSPPPPQYFTKRRTSKCSNTSEFTSSSPTSSGQQFMALFRRRASNASEVSNVEIQKETENVHRLYALAVDEVNFAEDSRGSAYYAGDLITAREAIDDCAGAFMRLLLQIPDHQLRTQLQSAITPRLLNLQEKFNALPPESSLISL